MKKLLIFLLLLTLYIQTEAQIFERVYEINTTGSMSKKALLDSISNYLFFTTSIINLGWYSPKRKLFSNRFIDEGGYNEGFISIDTVDKAIRFNYTGTTGSGGFAPTIQQTIYLKYLDTIYWSMGNKSDYILNLISFYNDICSPSYKPIAEIELISGCKNSEDRNSSMPDYTRSFFSEYKVEFAQGSLSAIKKNNLRRWLYEIKSR